MLLIEFDVNFANAEPMWQMGLGGGDESYPERPDEADCIHYLRTGFCGYGSRCRFNHPRDRNSVFFSYFYWFSLSILYICVRVLSDFM